MNRGTRIVNGFIDKKGDIIIPINSDGAIHIIKDSYKTEAVWKYDEGVEE